MRNRSAAFLAAGVIGVAALLLGQAGDFNLHAADPPLAHREGIFTLTNPGHVLLGAGLILAVVGVLGAAYSQLPMGSWSRRAFLAGFLVLIAVSGVTAGWAASIELAASQRLIATDQHAVAATHQAPATGAGHAGSTSISVTAAQLEAAARLYEQTMAAVVKYRDLRAAAAAGYQRMEPPDLKIAHYVTPPYSPDPDILKPHHFQPPIYYNSPKAPRLIAPLHH